MQRALLFISIKKIYIWIGYSVILSVTSHSCIWLWNKWQHHCIDRQLCYRKNIKPLIFCHLVSKRGTFSSCSIPQIHNGDNQLWLMCLIYMFWRMVTGFFGMDSSYFSVWKWHFCFVSSGRKCEVTEYSQKASRCYCKKTSFMCV